jgi:hypothetical protein
MLEKILIHAQKTAVIIVVTQNAPQDLNVATLTLEPVITRNKNFVVRDKNVITLVVALHVQPKTKSAAETLCTTHKRKNVVYTKETVTDVTQIQRYVVEGGAAKQTQNTVRPTSAKR